MKVLPYGDAGLLVEVDGLPEVLALADAVRATPPSGVLDIVQAARTVLLILAPHTDLVAVRQAVLALTVEPGAPPPADLFAFCLICVHLCSSVASCCLTSSPWPGCRSRAGS